MERQRRRRRKRETKMVRELGVGASQRAGLVRREMGSASGEAIEGERRLAW